jgi:hypothetical protein
MPPCPAPTTSLWRWRQQSPLKHWYPTTSLRGITMQKTTTWTLQPQLQLLVISSCRYSMLVVTAYLDNISCLHLHYNAVRHMIDKLNSWLLLCPWSILVFLNSHYFLLYNFKSSLRHSHLAGNMLHKLFLFNYIMRHLPYSAEVKKAWNSPMLLN